MIVRERLMVLALCAAGTAVAAGQAPAPSQQQPTFKLQVEYVEVDALVTDRAGTFVRDLKKEDFQVMEDGRSQTITGFSLVDIPVEHASRPLGAPSPIEADVRTNERPFDGRVYVLVIDDLHTRFGRVDRVKRAARLFIERHLGANDLMAVVHTRGGENAGQEFTNNKRLLLAAVDRTIGWGMRSATAERTDEYYRTQGVRRPGDPLNDPSDQERGYNARSTLDTLRSVADWFGAIHGRRKSILFFSEGIDYDINDVFNNREASTVIDTTRDAIAAATRSDVSIYTIDPRGLTNLGDEEIEIQSYPDDPTLGVGNSSLMNELRLSQDSLRVLAENTGGFAAVNRNDFTTAYERIVQDNSSYYVLAYYPPTTDKRDGRFHKIEVRVSRPGVSVRARQGYALPKRKPAAAPASTNGKSASSAEIREALESPLPVSGLTMNVFAVPFKGPQPNASVLLGIEMRGRDLTLTANNKVEVSYVAVDTSGKMRAGNTEQVTWGTLKPETRTRVEQTGVRLMSRIEIPPGRYQVRFAAHDSGGALGSVIYDLEVPDFYKAPLSMSGLALASRAGSVEPTTKPDEQLKDVLPAPPMALRTLPPNDELHVFAEVYDNQASTPHKVDITTTVTSDDGKVVFKAEEERASSDIQGKRGGYGYTARIPMQDLGSGIFVLKVEARSRLGSGPTASREVQFTVGSGRRGAGE